MGTGRANVGWGLGVLMWDGTGPANVGWGLGVLMWDGDWAC